MGKITIVLADDHAVVRAGLRALINAKPDMEVVGEAANGREATEQVELLGPDVLLLDLSMPRLSGLSALTAIKRKAPRTRVLILTMHDDHRYLHQALSAGASGYVVKKAADMELLSAIRAVMRGEIYVHSSLTKSLIERSLRKQRARAVTASPGADDLSKRQKEVLVLLAQGYTNQQIADMLLLSVKTVETYRARTMKILDLQTRAELFRYVLRKGWLPRDE